MGGAFLYAPGVSTRPFSKYYVTFLYTYIDLIDMETKTSDCKVSFYCTVYNEQDSISTLLDSLIAQKRPPDEIIIVDAGSTDKTVDIIKKYIRKGMNINLILAPGCNVSQGRNLAIENASHDIIASTDAGCRLDPYWLQNLLKELDDSVDIVSGISIADPETFFEICFSDISFPKPEDFKANWPTQQSILFRKKVWETIRFPEYCERSEDTYFNIKANQMGFRFRLAPDAKVYWKPRKNHREVFINSFRWTKSDIVNNVDRAKALRFGMETAFRLLILLSLLCIVILTAVAIFWLLSLPFVMLFVYKLIIRYPQEKNLHRILMKNSISYTSALGTLYGVIFALFKKKKWRN